MNTNKVTLFVRFKKCTRPCSSIRTIKQLENHHEHNTIRTVDPEKKKKKNTRKQFSPTGANILLDLIPQEAIGYSLSVKLW